MIKYFIYTISLLLVFSSCKPKTVSFSEEEIAARVYTSTLLEKDVLSQIPVESSMEDSVNIRNGIINSWVNKQLLVHQAELNLSEADKDVSLKLEKYKNDLLIFSYQNQLLREKLDTSITKIEIENYYNENTERFKLADYIVKYHYIQVDSATFKHRKVKKWFMSDDEEDLDKLEDFCHVHALNFSFEGNWQYFHEFVNNVPIITYKKEKLLKNKKLIELYDNGSLYLVRIVDYNLKDGISPLSLETKNIKRIILNNRKLEFLEKLRDDIYKKAKNTEEIEIFVH